jgi:hypothetical protein
VQQYGQVVFGCNSANERIEVAFVRVRKPDGTVVATSPASVQDLTAPVQRVAPVYTDFRQKHVTVESLRPGDTLQFRLVTTVRIPRSRRGTSGASTRSRRTGETRRARLTDIGSLCTRGVPEC